MTEKGDSDIVSNMMLLSGKHALCQIIKPSKSCPDRLCTGLPTSLPFKFKDKPTSLTLKFILSLSEVQYLNYIFF